MSAVLGVACLYLSAAVTFGAVVQWERLRTFWRRWVFASFNAMPRYRGGNEGGWLTAWEQHEWNALVKSCRCPSEWADDPWPDIRRRP